MDGMSPHERKMAEHRERMAQLQAINDILNDEILLQWLLARIWLNCLHEISSYLTMEQLFSQKSLFDTLKWYEDEIEAIRRSEMDSEADIE